MFRSLCVAAVINYLFANPFYHLEESHKEERERKKKKINSLLGKITGEKLTRWGPNNGFAEIC